MAPKRTSSPGRSARYYRSNPEARAKKNAYNSKRNKTAKSRKYRSGLNKERRKRGIYGKGGPDMSHTKSGRLVAESPRKNRARNGAGGKSTKK